MTGFRISGVEPCQRSRFRGFPKIGSRVWGLGFRVEGLGFRVWVWGRGLGFRVPAISHGRVRGELWGLAGFCVSKHWGSLFSDFRQEG